MKIAMKSNTSIGYGTAAGGSSSNGIATIPVSTINIEDYDHHSSKKVVASPGKRLALAVSAGTLLFAGSSLIGIFQSMGDTATTIKGTSVSFMRNSQLTTNDDCGSCYGTDQNIRCCNTCDEVKEAFNSCPACIVKFNKQEIPQCGGTKVIDGKSPLGSSCKTDDNCMSGKCLDTNLNGDDDGSGYDPNNSLLCFPMC